MHNRTLCCVRRAIPFLLLLLAIPLWGQTPTGTISGTVKDATGGAVPNATVTVQNVESGYTRSGVTDNDGAYRFPALPVGKYSVKAENMGFKTETQTGLTLDVAQEEVVNFTLEVGTTQQQVLVTAEAPQINTTSAAIGHVVDEQQIADLPLNGRNFADLSLLQSGITQYQPSNALGLVGLWFSANGAPLRSNMFTLDGAIMGNVNGASPSQISGETLGVDAIQEYKLMTNDFSAEYGLTMGSQMTIVTKSGTNQFHGDAFEYLRNSVLDARQFYDELYQLPSTVSGGGRRVAPFRRNQYGGALGGPIQKDKTFFFSTFEGFQEVLDNPTYVAPAVVPPAACHFFGTAAGVTAIPLSTTNNTVNNAACLTPLKVAGTGATTTVDNSILTSILPAYPNPNFINGGLPSFDFLSTQTTRDDYGQIRIDHTFSSADTFFGRYTIDDSQQTRPTAFPGFDNLWTQRSQYITLSENHVFSPTLLNSARFSYSRSNVYQVAQNPGYTGPTCATGAATVCGLSGSPISSFGLGTSNPVFQTQNVFQWGDDLFWTKGKHALKFGTMIDYWQQFVDNNAKAGGLVTFSSFQTFLQGNYSSISIPVANSYFGHYMLFDTVGMYVQDDYHVLPRLTLNLGLRYEFVTTPTEKRGREAYITNITTQTTYTPGPMQSDPSYKDVSPRFGFAWDIFGNGKTSLRGGAALLYDVAGIGTIYGAAGAGPPFALYAGTATKPLVLPEPLPPAPANIYSPAGTRFTTLEYYYTTPHMADFNLSIERQLPGDIALSVAYAGSRGMDLWQFGEGNPRCPTSNPFVPVGCAATTTAVGPTEWMNAKAPLENSYFGTINYIHTGGESWYNSLQVNLTKRTSHGLEFQTAYTYSKVLDDNQGQLSQDAAGTTVVYNLNTYIPQEDWGPADFDVRQNLRFNALYHVPNIGSSTFAKLEHGWWVGTVVGVQTGEPFTITLNTNRDQSDEDNGSGGIDRPNVVTSANLATVQAQTAQAQATAGCAGNPAISPVCSYTPVVFNKNTVITGNPNQWYNPNMFSLPAVGVLGSESRNMLTGPGIATWDLNFNKDTALHMLGEAGQLQFRAEFFNILNHPNFGQPGLTAFTGTTTDLQEGSAETPIGTTTTNPREIQFSLKVLF